MIRFYTEEGAFVPCRATSGSAGFDLANKGTFSVVGSTNTLVPTGVCVSIPSGYVGLLIPRSSLANLNLQLANTIGVIDEDYRGEIKMLLRLIDTTKPVSIHGQQRLAQLVVIPYQGICSFFSGKDQEETARGESGFGSTGL